MQPLEVTGDAGQRRVFQGTDRQRDQGGQIVAVAPPGRPLQHGRVDKAVARQPAHRAGRRRPLARGAPAATFAYLARRACSMNARRTAFMRVW